MQTLKILDRRITCQVPKMFCIYKNTDVKEFWYTISFLILENSREGLINIMILYQY